MAKAPNKSQESAESRHESAVENSIEVELSRQLDPILKNLPNVQREQILGRIVGVVQSEQYSGPIPHPRHLREYNEIIPGGAERILAMTEKQQEHNMAVQNKIVDCEIRDRHVGMACGFIAFAGLIVLAYYAGMADKTVLAGLLLGTAAIGGVVAFIKGRAH